MQKTLFSQHLKHAFARKQHQTPWCTYYVATRRFTQRFYCTQQPTIPRNTEFISPETVVDGLDYFPDYITPEEESQILSIIERNKWSHAIRRRTQYYGPVYY